MTFDFVQFFESNSISYISQGKNVKTGNVNIACPFCQDDPSHHLGINLESGAWGCWRDRAHRGRRAERLLMRLKRLTWDEAKLLVQEGNATAVGWDSLKERAYKLTMTVTKPPQEFAKFSEGLKYPEDFRRIKPEGPRQRFLEYLEGRGFDDPQKVADLYGLKCCLSGDFRYRIIVPFEMGRKLLGWTGRAITPSDLRYKNWPPGDATKRLLFNYDSAMDGGSVLTVVEGAFSAMYLNWYGRGQVKSVATLGVNLTDTQIELILRLAERFDKVVVLFDVGAMRQALDVRGRLLNTRARVMSLPHGVAQPDGMTPQQIQDLLSQV